MREWQKIAFAGFTGGLVFVGVASVVGIGYLWLAFLIGFAAGYLGYEFRETVHGVSEAWRGTRRAFAGFFSPLVSWIRASPLFILLTFVVCLYVGFLAPRFVVIVFDIAVFAMLFASVHTVLVGIATLGAKIEGRFFFVSPKPFFQVDEYSLLEKRRAYRADGLVEEVAGFRNASRWLFGGSFETFFFLATAWFYIIPAGKMIFHFLSRFLTIIHSSKRMMCGSGGVIGGYIAYALFWRVQMTVPHVAILLVSGAVLGAYGALLEWKVAGLFVDRRTSVCA